MFWALLRIVKSPLGTVLQAIRENLGDKASRDCVLLAGVVRDREFWEAAQADARWNTKRRAEGLAYDDYTLAQLVEAEGPSN